MKDNLYDRVIDKSLARVEKVTNKIARNFKGEKPFGMEPVSRKEALMEADEMTPEIEAWLRGEFGDDAVDAYKLT